MAYELGDAVEYKVGRGWGKGTVDAVEPRGIVILTVEGRRIKRKDESLRKPAEGGAA